MVTAGAVQAGGTDICPIETALRKAADTSPIPGPSLATASATVLTEVTSGTSSLGTISAAGAARLGSMPRFFSAPMIPVPIELMLLIERHGRRRRRRRQQPGLRWPVLVGDLFELQRRPVN
ncbi:hypothetical protein A4G28_24970 [Mycobacterium ostraviense]|uniref:Uncharacterized protein n=2 Tax=Mycobacterium ostraviense TaxID=2738409 RepID=A0A164APD7_9MYCO|nr:hypothetical protein A4G28_24970 [Mycobacterium ostraviense]